MSKIGKAPPIGRPVLVGTLAIVTFFGGLGGWAATAPLSAAAHASGQVRVESYRKTVQHLEGGIVSEILVRNGDLVEAGQVLLRLADVQAGSSVTMLSAELDALLARQSRLLAERDDRADIKAPAEFQARLLDPVVAKLLDDEDRLFRTRLARQQGQIALLEERIGQLDSEADSYRAQLEALEARKSIVAEQLAVAENLSSNGLAARATLLPIRKELVEIDGNVAQQQAMIARSEQAIGETRLQIIELANARAEEASAALGETDARIQQVQEQLRAASDVKTRTSVVAPQAGRVMSLRQFTTGGIVRPGEDIMEIVPDDGLFIIEASVSAYDIDMVRAGLEAEIKLVAFQQRTLPLLIGTVRSVSADALLDQRTGTSYYTAEVVLSADQLAATGGLELYPGMPADVMIKIRDRTMLDYFVEPIKDSFRRAMRES